MARPWVATARDNLQISRVSKNILKKHAGAADRDNYRKC
jgi:hypothetical protein